MCGICGVVEWNETGRAAELVRRMTPTMLHRGPDEEGYFFNGPVALGVRRLSIIDPEGGHQPVFNEDRMVAAVVNGEIYNFRELRDRLWDRGHTFSTRSDSEVVAHAFEEWGPDCVHYLEGMFALAVHDRRPAVDHPSFFLARDPLGIKPCYYYVGIADCGLPIANLGTDSPVDSIESSGQDSLSGNRSTYPQSAIPNSQSALPVFVFASEVRTLLASGIIPRQLSGSGLQSYLSFGSVSEPQTLVKGVLSLPPGHRIIIRLDGTRTATVKPECYWNLSGQRPRTHQNGGNGRTKLVAADGKRGEDQGKRTREDSTSAATRVRTLLEHSVREHLVADVPLGVFLSSGIDSTSLAALASRELSGVHTFTLDFAEAEFSEAAIARRTARQFGTNHRELLLSAEEMLNRLDEAVGAMDQPTMDGINTYFVSWAAREAGLKVALSGVGGDEVFGGYSSFRRTPHYERIAAIGSRMPSDLRKTVAAVVSSAALFTHGDAARKIAALWSEPQSFPHPYFFGRALFTPPQVSQLMTKGADCRGALWWGWLSAAARDAGNRDAFGAVSCLETRSYLVNTLLRDTDSMSMANSLEVRVPFLDRELVDFVTRVPEHFKLRRGRPKALLVAALKDLLPAEVVNHHKRGFTLPWTYWLRGPLRRRVEEGLSEIAPAFREVLNQKRVSRVWKSHLRGHTSWSRPWSLYVLNEWAKRHLESGV
ncbi:MAG TPA: asparagine synthase-related protein [Pyrinomonadaceae bacterium]|nr:asparagine synthase-related protein [Pyrinomonadaceae bacterium]